MDRASRLLLVFAITGCVAFIYLYPLTLPTPLLDPDEGLHASIAQEMVERGDYVVPRFCCKPFLDKPIVFFLADAASLRSFGMNEAAVRLPGELFMLAGCLTTAILAWRLYDKEVAIYALVASLTLVLPIMLSLSPAPDIALVPAVNLLALCFWEQERATISRRRWAWLVGGALAVALALLTKGLIGIAVLSAGIGLYTLATRSYSWRLIWACTFVIAMGALLAAPWFLAMDAASPGYLKYYFIDRHLLGYLTEDQYHGKAPWYYYFAPVLGGSMPWLLYALAAYLQSWRDDRSSTESRATQLLACWFVGGFVFLTFANSKLVTYSLPLFTPIAILGGLSFCRFFRGTLVPSVRWIMAATFRLACLFGVLGTFVTLWVFDYFLDAPSPGFAYAVASLASAVIALAWFIFERNRRPMAFAIGILWFPLAFVALINGPFQKFAELHSQQTLAEEIRKLDKMPERLVMIGEQAGSIMFYLTPSQRDWFRDGRLHNAPRTELDELASLPAQSIVAIEDKELGRTPWADEVQRIDPSLFGRFHLFDAMTLRRAGQSAAAQAEQKTLR
jgi:4-amino-4-deoxy-L-arabinose transferase-like glycosyltransferase